VQAVKFFPADYQYNQLTATATATRIFLGTQDVQY